MSNEPVRSWSLQDLSDAFGPSPRWWKTYTGELLRTGALAKRGKLFFGRASAIEAWLLGAHRSATRQRGAA